MSRRDLTGKLPDWLLTRPTDPVEVVASYRIDTSASKLKQMFNLGMGDGKKIATGCPISEGAASTSEGMKAYSMGFAVGERHRVAVEAAKARRRS